MPRSQGRFELPPDVTFSREHLPIGWAYVFRHAELGELGRIVLQSRPDGRTNVVCEVVGDPGDPMTARRRAVFEPLGRALSAELDKATGGSGASTGSGRTEPPVAARNYDEPTQAIASKLIQCEQCGLGVALLIFADHARDRSGLEDYARLMYPKVVELDVPTWVISPPLGDRPSPEGPSDILKIWPEREPVRRLTPDEFGPTLDQLVEGHCG